jgi:molybdopterin converting factor small subunit
MATKILIPTPLRQYTEKNEALELCGSNVAELLRSLTHRYPVLKQHLFNEDGRLRSFVNIYVNDEDIRYLQKEDTKVTEKDVVSIVPSIAGGQK